MIGVCLNLHDPIITFHRKLEVPSKVLFPMIKNYLLVISYQIMI